MENGQVEVISLTLTHPDLQGTLYSVWLEAVDCFQYVVIGAQPIQTVICVHCFTLTRFAGACTAPVQCRVERTRTEEAPRIGGRGKPREPSSLKLKRRLGRAARKLILLSAEHDVKAEQPHPFIGRMNAAHGTARLCCAVISADRRPGLESSRPCHSRAVLSPLGVHLYGVVFMQIKRHCIHLLQSSVQAVAACFAKSQTQHRSPNRLVFSGLAQLTSVLS